MMSVNCLRLSTSETIMHSRVSEYQHYLARILVSVPVLVLVRAFALALAPVLARVLVPLSCPITWLHQLVSSHSNRILRT